MFTKTISVKYKRLLGEINEMISFMAGKKLYTFEGELVGNIISLKCNKIDPESGAILTINIGHNGEARSMEIQENLIFGIPHEYGYYVDN